MDHGRYPDSAATWAENPLPAIYNLQSLPRHPISEIYRRWWQILLDGPISSKDWYSFDLVKIRLRKSDDMHMVFNPEDLRQMLCWVQAGKPFPKNFARELCAVVSMLPIQEGQVIDREVLYDLMFEAAKQCEMGWYRSLRAKFVVLWAILGACAIARYKASQTGDELSKLMEKVTMGGDEGMDADDLVKLMEKTGLGSDSEGTADEALTY